MPHSHAENRRMAVMLAMLMSIMPFSIDTYLPSLPQIAQSLNSDIHYIEKSLSTFFFGVAIGQIIGGSLSDIKGRRLIALIGLCIYITASCSLIFVQTADQLLGLRLVQALGAGMSAVVVGALVRDNYLGKKAAQMFALIGIISMAAPLVAPMLGSILQMIGGWRAVFVFLFVYGLLMFALLFCFLPSNKAPEKLTGEQVKNIFSRYHTVLTTKPALGFLFYQAASFASMLAFLSESPFVYMQLYKLTPNQYAWVFGCNIVMMMICNHLTAFGLRRNWESRDLLKIGMIIQNLANLALVAIVLVTKQPELWLLVPFAVVSIGTLGLISANTQAMFMANFKPEIAGSANAMLSAGQSLIASCVGFLVTQLHNGTVFVMVSMMLASTLTGFVLLHSFSKSQMQPEK
ncbi:multidrug effflux MFS transporter [Kingella negevensis]|uniref:Bcr/CflA family efflux transporter n=1 Tax=Kingella negevensis TaxID=1522312 RepID=A0A238TEA3_9NEIS|nr:multidrug effflux MFS transporter [Kingella negevensis]MDK4697489.1 multidrug effflux MFS transporter [Kingella negevensis]SNB85207.1 Bicyclomycin resistance protein [Kingella negevensis]